MKKRVDERTRAWARASSLPSARQLPAHWRGPSNVVGTSLRSLRHVQLHHERVAVIRDEGFAQQRGGSAEVAGQIQGAVGAEAGRVESHAGVRCAGAGDIPLADLVSFNAHARHFVLGIDGFARDDVELMRCGSLGRDGDLQRQVGAAERPARGCEPNRRASTAGASSRGVCSARSSGGWVPARRFVPAGQPPRTSGVRQSGKGWVSGPRNLESRGPISTQLVGLRCLWPPCRRCVPNASTGP